MKNVETEAASKKLKKIKKGNNKTTKGTDNE